MGSGADAVSLGELGAVVYPSSVPAGLAEELPSLYSSLLSTPRWFRMYTDVEATGALVLSNPRHVLLFRMEDDTIDVLNRFFEMSPDDARRACLALFRGIAHARRIRLEVVFPPEGLRVPKQELYSTDHLVISLPETVEDYDAMLGRRTRGNIRNFRNRLGHDFPDADTEVFVPGDRGKELLELLQEWKIARFAARGRTTYWENDSGVADSFLDRLRDGGEAHVTTIAGAPAAIRFTFPVGKTVFAVQSAFDPRYERYRLGLVSGYLMVCDSVRRGATRVNLMWGTEDYKKHLGAVPARATLLSVYRSRRARLLFVREAWDVNARRLNERARDRYWRARHALRRRIDGRAGEETHREGADR